MVRCYKTPVFTVSNLRVSSHDRLSDFFTSSWQLGDSGMPMLVLRLALAILALLLLSWAVAEAPNPYWLLFLTNWGLILVCGMMVSGVVVSIAAVNKTLQADSIDLPWYVTMYWVFYNTGIALSFMISALYWILLYNPDMKDVEGPRLYWLDVATHGLNAGLVLVELLASHTPLVFAHIYQPLIIGLSYALLTLIYYICGGTDINGQHYIYDILNWEHKIRSSLVVLLATVSLILIWCIMFGITFCRDKLSYVMLRPQATASVSPMTDVQDLRSLKQIVDDFRV